MKYILGFLLAVLLLVMRMAYFLLERSIKLLIMLAQILWHFTIRKKWLLIFKQVDFILLWRDGQYIDLCHYRFNTIRDYFLWTDNRIIYIN